jgi:hypothetical protein
MPLMTGEMEVKIYALSLEGATRAGHPPGRGKNKGGPASRFITHLQISGLPRMLLL